MMGMLERYRFTPVAGRFVSTVIRSGEPRRFSKDGAPRCEPRLQHDFKLKPRAHSRPSQHPQCPFSHESGPVRAVQLSPVGAHSRLQTT